MQDKLKVMVVGLGQLGRSLVLAMGLQWAHQRPGTKLPLTLVDATDEVSK